MSRGTIRRRGKASWEVKFDTGIDALTGKRQTRYVTVRGKRQDAQRELTRLLGTLDGGSFVEPDQVTVEAFVRAWLAGADISAKTRERYTQIAEAQIIPHLGATKMQKLRPAHIEAWHKALLERGSKAGKPLTTRTVGHCHRLLRTILQAAVRSEALTRNVASVISPPRVEDDEVKILKPGEVTVVLSKLVGHALHVIAATALGTGMRRGELLAVAWSCLDLDKATLRVERSLEQTKAGLRFRPPKTKAGRRVISLPASVVTLLRDHRRKQLETRLMLGVGRPPEDGLVFCNPDGSAASPDSLSWRWRDTVRSLKLPRVSFHALRHTHASALIAAGLDVVQISRRLGHANPTVTLRVYAHMFCEDDTAAALAIDAVLR